MMTQKERFSADRVITCNLLFGLNGMITCLHNLKIEMEMIQHKSIQKIIEYYHHLQSFNKYYRLTWTNLSESKLTVSRFCFIYFQLQRNSLRSKHRWEDNIKINLGEVGLGALTGSILLRIGTGG